MCGIAGYFGKGSKEILNRMATILAHRGPDDSGVIVHKEVGLAHRRLSILDLSPAGHQPLTNEDGTVIIVFNGEIYNFKDIRSKLMGTHRFAGHSDTEVIVHRYEEVGEKVFEEIQGMFAIALYDTKKHRLYLARDRMGKKPLYWALFDTTLIFGSELKALVAHPLFKKEINEEALSSYLLFEYVPAPETIWKKVHKLESGTSLSFDGTQIVKKRFWNVSFRDNPISFRDATLQLDELLNRAVQDRLVADVPVGVLLSGGLDSSAIAYYAQKNTKNKIQTFSIGFEDESFDESKYARRVADFLGTDHHEYRVTEKEALDIIPHIADIIDEPLADASIVPTSILSRFTREQVKVALGGDGGDELMAGYVTFIAHQAAEWYGIVPFFIRSRVEPLLLKLPTSRANFSFDFKVKKFINGFSGDKHFRDARWLGSFGFEDQERLLRAPYRRYHSEGQLLAPVSRYIKEVPHESYMTQLLYLYQKMYMQESVLVKVDRASMFAGLEVRAPFLDTRVVDFLNGLPFHFKQRYIINTKYILKKTMQKKLPEDIVFRKKKGFGMPVATWLAGPLKPLMLDLLSSERLEKQGIFNPTMVNTLIEDHIANRKDNRKMLWTLIVFQLWWNRWYA